MSPPPDSAIAGRSRLAPRFGGATFGLRHRVLRLGFRLAWLVLARWTPPQLHAWRRLLLRMCGADLAPTARVYSDVVVWWPPYLSMGEHASMGPGVICYNVGRVTVGALAVVSQRAHLCSGTHDCDDEDFPLRARPIVIGARSWVAAESFVGPGVTIGEGAVLGARGVAFRDLHPWTIYAGNPAQPIRKRRSPFSGHARPAQEASA